MIKKSLLLSGLLLTAGLDLSLQSQPDPIYLNRGMVDFSDSPVINALAFANYGSFNVSSDLPFDTMNTLNFTNRGIMSASVGFNFQHIASNGRRSPALNFVNDARAEIIAESGLFIGSGFITGNDLTVSPAFLQIAASNVVNHGYLRAAASGLLRIEGNNVNLFNGGFEIEPIAGVGGAVGTTNFLPDTAIQDIYWGGITNLVWDTSRILIPAGDSLSVIAPPHSVTNAEFFLPSIELLQLPNPESYAISNVFGTNVVVQSVFALAGPGMRTAAKFFPSFRDLTLNTALLEITANITNVVNGDLDQINLYLKDELAWNTNHTQLLNVYTGTYRPAVYDVSRSAPFEWLFGLPPNVEAVPELLWGPTYSNTVTTNLYAAYSAQAENSVTRQILIEDSSVDDLPGRIEINAGNLDLRNARFRGEGIVTINADHLISSAGSVVDSPNVSFNLTSTNGMLDVRDVGKMTTDRFRGRLQMFSMIWTNINTVVEEIEIDPPPDPDNPDPDPITVSVTNTFNIFHHILVVDGRGLQTGDVPVFTYDFTANGTNVVVRDAMQIVRSFQSDAQNLEVAGDLSFFGDIQNIGATNLPNLRELTISGSFDVPNLVAFGFGAEGSFERFVNNGALSAFSPRIAADYFENTGEIVGGGNVEIHTQTAKMDGGNINSGRDIVLNGRNVKLRETRIASGQRLLIDVSDVLTDSGPGSENLLSVGDGFIMQARPSAGDLLGTTIESTVPRFSRIDHVWSSEDRGAIAAGFENNSAIGQLILSAPRGSQVRFLPANVPSAIYVDRLELQSELANDWRNGLLIGEGMVLYFADANLPVEELDGALEGRLRWVRSYAGENSSVDIIISETGRTVRVNRGFRESLTIDSDGDGTANGIDPTPFEGVILTDIEVDPGKESVQTSISWMAAARTSYRVEYRSVFAGGSWELLQSVRNEAGERQKITVIDEVGLDKDTRFYRVTYSLE